MTLFFEAGWEWGTGVAGISVDEGGGSVVVDVVASGTQTFCHTDISANIATGEYVDLATALQDALNASGSLSDTYTVTYNDNVSPPTYTISSTGTFSYILTGSLLRAAIGFSSETGSTAASHSSDMQCKYLIEGYVGGASNVTDEYEPDGITETAVSEDGTPYSISVSTAATYYDIRVPMEPLANIFTREADSDTTASGTHWVWQDFFAHVRGHHPFTICDDTYRRTCVLRGDSTHFRPVREVPDWDGAWNVDLKTHQLGRDAV